jgi:hypothetical protein
MCHHSLPSIIAPIKRKEVVTTLFCVDYLAILLAYFALGFSSLAAFGGLPEDIPGNPKGACPPTAIAAEPHACPIQARPQS